MKLMTLAEAEAVLAHHEAVELAVDIPGTLATLVDEPHYELPSIGYELRGMEAVKAWYERTLGYWAEREITAVKRVHAFSPESRSICREAHVRITIDGQVVHCNYSAVITISEDGKISNERLYTDPYFASMHLPALGEDFADVPGVTPMPWFKHMPGTPVMPFQTQGTRA